MIEIIVKAFLLGISSGVTCLFTCAPALIPFVLGEGRGISKNFLILINFLIGRLAGYILTGILAWYVTRPVFQNIVVRDLLTGLSFIALSSLLIFYFIKGSHFNNKASCPNQKLMSLTPADIGMCLSLGFFTALTPCPPFFLAIFEVSNGPGVFAAIIFFISFFVGTSIYFTFIPFAGSLCGNRHAKAIGRMAAGLVGSYYMYQGIIKTIGGMRTLWSF
ncbi:MAG TPA: sulfite exporter TauE/SafE family protein [Candidatus Wallbacteria bacterium]|nr:sulfite exporter TauE/SafE family protein [Candidatus Wallbacteria bacterium]